MTALRTSIATVCLSGTLDEKLQACAAAGFDGVEIFEPDLVVSPLTPAQVRDRCAELGLTIDLYQPLRDLDGVSEDLFAANLRRAEGEFALMREARRDARAGLHQRGHGDRRRRPGVRRPAAPPRRPRRPLRRVHRLRGPGVGALRQQLRARSPDRRPGGPPPRRHLPRLLPHPVAALGPLRDRVAADPVDLLRAARRRPRPRHGRAVLEPAPTASSPVRAPGTWSSSSCTCSRPATPGRCRWRSSTTPSGRATCSAPPSTRTARWCGWPTAPRG